VRKMYIVTELIVNQYRIQAKSAAEAEDKVELGYGKKVGEDDSTYEAVLEKPKRAMS
jgi:hypothetical protein